MICSAKSVKMITRYFLSACRTHENINDVTTNLGICEKYHETKKLWNLRRESTCTYNQHMGHYQATMRDSILSWFFFQRGKVPSLS